MKDRIQQFLLKENKSSAQLAEEIGVQPSGISHILSGRNKPSLDFVIKMLDRYPYLSIEWLLFGRGPMYKEKTMPTLFDEMQAYTGPSDVYPEEDKRDSKKIERDDLAGNHEHSEENTPADEPHGIIFFYDDGTFRSFRKRSL